MFGRKKKKDPIKNPVIETMTIPESADLYFPVYGTQKHQDVLSIVAAHTIERVGPSALYGRFSDEKLKDIGIKVDQVYELSAFVSITPVELGYDVTCKHGQIGFMPEHIISEYEDLAGKYQKKTARIYLYGGKAKYYDAKQGEICFDESDYEAKCRITFKQPL